MSTYSYDDLNRNTGIVYTNDSSGTLPVTRIYDQAIKGKGRLYQSQTTGPMGSLTTVDSYDALGRPLQQRQQFYASGAWSQSYSTQRSYDLTGAVVTQTYPSDRTVSYGYDSAGRTSSFTGNLGGTARNYATGITYSPFGGVDLEQFGSDTALYQKLHYNIRGQLYGVFLSTDGQGWNRGAIVNYYSFQPYGFGTSGPDNNGNLLVQQHWVPADDASSSFMQQNYDYDALNRLTWVGEYANGATATGSQNFGYDRWGNRTITGVTGSGINNKQFTVNTTNNRLGVPSGQSGTMSYDAAGNLTTDTYSSSGVTRVYDADNRMTSEAQANGYVAGAYTYNADGQRVRRKVGATETWQVYGIDGELLAEYAAAGAFTSPQKEYGYRNGQLLITAEPNAGNNAVQWLVADQLGTPRMIADKTGSLAGIKRHDYLPFGEELYAGTGNRTAVLGYSADSVRQKFTSHERDTETGLDYMQARYFNNQAGRFISPDSIMGSSSSPQTLNLYSYVVNNPLRYTDPTGNKLEDIGIYQTTNPEVDRLCGRAEDQMRKNWLAGQPDPSGRTVGGASSTGQTGATLQVRGTPGEGLSSGNPLRFPGTKQTLGPASLDYNWGYQVEESATVPDDVSAWTLTRTWEDRIGIHYKDGSTFRGSKGSGSETGKSCLPAHREPPDVLAGRSRN